MTAHTLLSVSISTLAIATIVTGINRLIADHEARVQRSIDRAYTINAGHRGQCIAEIAIELGRPAHQVRLWLEAEDIDAPPFSFTPATYGRSFCSDDDA